MMVVTALFETEHFVLETCETLKEAKQRLPLFGDAVIVDAKTGEIVQ